MVTHGDQRKMQEKEKSAQPQSTPQCFFFVPFFLFFFPDVLIHGLAAVDNPKDDLDHSVALLGPLCPLKLG